MPPLEAWEKVILTGSDAEAFFASVHGQIPCVVCHEGDGDASEKEDAHAGMIGRPSETPSEVCGQCHSGTQNLRNSLHGGLWGEKNLVAQRYGVDSFDDLPESVKHGYGTDCAGCHTSCGDCHVGRPASVGGGLVAGHRFGTPHMTEQCTACHGSRVGAEYRGENDGFSADVHFVPGGMRCQSCHSAAEMHGDGTRPDHRLDVANHATCEECHQESAKTNEYHQAHWSELQCQVCHSQEYKSCNTCHAGEGLAEPSYMSFKIGKNPVPEKRPYDYVLLRHIPVSPDTYRNWGVPDLTEYESEPTWKYAAPHNIQRWTDRTEVPDGGTCSTNCHGSSDGTDGFFLRQSDLDAMDTREAEANRDVVVPDGSPVNW